MGDSTPQIHIWLDGEPGLIPAAATIDDIPGESDIDLIARAIVEGRLGRYLPSRMKYATRPQPRSNQVRSLDTARLLSTYRIRHRRRYEVFPDL
jgi:hypothetical protein